MRIKNPFGDDVTNLLMIGAVGVLAYFLYKKYVGAASGATLPSGSAGAGTPGVPGSFAPSNVPYQGISDPLGVAGGSILDPVQPTGASFSFISNPFPTTLYP